MIVEIGHYALILSLSVAIVQSILPLLGARRGDARLMETGTIAATGGFVLITIAFSALVTAHVTSDFSVLNVYQNSQSAKPLLYKITGVWGNHEGSMLLWVLILAFFGSLVALFGRDLPAALKANVLAVQAWILTAFLLFILLTSNPFTRLEPAPMDGQGLNPILQDIGLAIHPPLLYLGYVGFSIAFSFAVAALIDGRIDAAWARWVRPWTLIAWIFLTLGISMGSYWAYYELGWGGWWFWDPVENASFMPWLAGTALLHSALVMEKRAALKIWTILLAILTFSLSLLGTFLVRSGVLTSVHAFATDPTRGVFILCILCLFIGGALSLFAMRASSLEGGGLFAPISREGALVFNNLFLTTAAATVLVGTLYPLLLEVTIGKKISVGAPFFDLTFGPLMVPLLFAVPFGPLLGWKRGDLLGAGQRLYFAAGVALAALLVTLALTSGARILAAFGFALAFWLIAGSLTDLVLRAAFLKVGWRSGLSRLIGLPRSAFGTAFAHFGLGVTVLGIITVSSFQTENITTMAPGQTVDAGGYAITFEKIVPRAGPNYEEQGALFSVRQGGVEMTTLDTAKRFYPARQTSTTEAGIWTHWFSQLYLSLGDPSADKRSVVVRIWWKPLVTLIWIGGIFMAIGGAFSLADRRLRVGAPSRRRQAVPAAVRA
ncbi:heme lyase CcmF/NrfE family subunit [Jiella sp. MQZ9-1]|uniref:Heme lyase CcmF/NrfE family subunit n=1 Tax=Jiella flava TaxID=2816857 RepID=A0A939JUW7_9HYPH|nr:heme lyase CcmF/NrfE family subunit [Jiella flava]MBO0661849.1 heme lyase CcmF/NrfE family subunit [Jiella flava]MCD2470489.1 heme lyase CcmF/NrfE family subunit [Jiella flava]